MPDPTTSQRAEVIDLIEAIYSHEGVKPQWADGKEVTLPKKYTIEDWKFFDRIVTMLDMHAFVGVWVPWLLQAGWEPFLPRNGFAWHKKYTTDEEDQDITFCGACYSHIKHKLAVTSPNFILATARAVRAQQTGGA